MHWVTSAARAHRQTRQYMVRHLRRRLGHAPGVARGQSPRPLQEKANRNASADLGSAAKVMGNGT